MAVRKLSFLLLVLTLVCSGPAAAQPSATPANPEMVVDAGQSMMVTAVVISPDGTWQASWGRSGPIEVRALPDGQLLRSFDVPMPPRLEAVFHQNLAISDDGLLLAFASPDESSIRIWEVSSGLLKHRLAIELPATAISFSPDSSTLAGRDRDDTVRLWRIADGRTLLSLRSPRLAQADDNGTVGNLVFTRDGRQLLFGNGASAVRLVDTATGSERTLYTHQGFPVTVAVSPDGNTIVSSTVEEAAIWTSATQRATLLKDRGPVLVACFTSNNDRFVTRSDREFVVWSASARAPVERQASAIAAPLSMRCDRAASQVVTVQFDVETANAVMKDLEQQLQRDPMAAMRTGLSFIRTSIVNLTKQVEAERAAVSLRLATTLDFKSDDVLLIGNAMDAGLAAWDLKSGRPTLMKTPPAAGFLASPDRSVLAGCDLKNLIVLDMTSLLPTATVPFEWCVRIAFSDDSRIVAALGERQIEFRQLPTGRLISTVHSDSDLFVGVVFSRDSQRVTTVTSDGVFSVWNVADGTERVGEGFRYSAAPIDAVTRNPRDETLLIGTRARNLVDLDPSTGRVIRERAGGSGFVGQLVYSPNGQRLAVTGHPLRIWSAERGLIYEPQGRGSGPVRWLNDSTVIFSTTDSTVRIWNLDKPDANATLMWNIDGAEWGVFSDLGYFDGTPIQWGAVSWRFRGNTFDVLPVEVFFSEFFAPSLFTNVLSGSVVPPARALATKDRRQPAVSIVASTALNGRVSLQIEVKEAGPDREHREASGARDLRLFRNGSMIRAWRGDLVGRRSGAATFNVTVPLIAGENEFYAYVFNRDNVKSRDFFLDIEGPGPPRKGVLHIVGIGINEYRNPRFNLRFAVADVEAVARVLSEQRGGSSAFDRVEFIPILDDAATKANVLAVLDRLSGNSSGRGRLPGQFAKLAPVRPEDTVLIYFAGHGMASNGEFYLVPHDLGYNGPLAQLASRGLETLRERSISLDELGRSLEPLDVKDLVLIVDACESGAALDSEEQRRGPMNSKGFAQLAYEKGMHVLAAAQSTEVANEATDLGHGLLTYALTIEGIEKGGAASDGVVDVRSWLEFATMRVPKLHQQYVDAPPSSDAAARRSQQPRAYFRPENRPPSVIATVPK